MRTKADISARWSKREGDILYHWEGGAKPTAMLVADVLQRLPTHTGKPLAEELAARGYDLTTLRFEIRRAPSPRAQESET